MWNFQLGKLVGLAACLLLAACDGTSGLMQDAPASARPDVFVTVTGEPDRSGRMPACRLDWRAHNRAAEACAVALDVQFSDARTGRVIDRQVGEVAFNGIDPGATRWQSATVDGVRCRDLRLEVVAYPGGYDAHCLAAFRAPGLASIHTTTSLILAVQAAGTAGD